MASGSSRSSGARRPGAGPRDAEETRADRALRACPRGSVVRPIRGTARGARPCRRAAAPRVRVRELDRGPRSVRRLGRGARARSAGFRAPSRLHSGSPCSDHEIRSTRLAKFRASRSASKAPSANARDFSEPAARVAFSTGAPPLASERLAAIGVGTDDATGRGSRPALAGIGNEGAGAERAAPFRLFAIGTGRDLAVVSHERAKAVLFAEVGERAVGGAVGSALAFFRRALTETDTDVGHLAVVAARNASPVDGRAHALLAAAFGRCAVGVRGRRARTVLCGARAGRLAAGKRSTRRVRRAAVVLDEVATARLLAGDRALAIIRSRCDALSSACRAQAPRLAVGRALWRVPLLASGERAEHGDKPRQRPRQSVHGPGS